MAQILLSHAGIFRGVANSEERDICIEGTGRSEGDPFCHSFWSELHRDGKESRLILDSSAETLDPPDRAPEGRSPQEQAALYRALFETIPDGILIVDDEGRYLDVNDAYCAMLKATREQLLGAHFSTLIPPDRLEEAVAAFGRLRNQGEVAMEFPMTALDGTQVELEWRSRANFLPGLHFCMARDVRNRKRVELELRQAKETAEAASRAKDQFLATLSHELRTPLTPVLALVSGLERHEHVHPELHKVLDVIRRNVELEARLIDDLLDLTRIARGKLELHPEVTDACKVIEHTLEICCESEVTAGRLHLVKDVDPGDHRVWADPSRLTQVLWNLLSNAVKFTPAGGTLTVRLYCEAEGLVFEISDTGIGIDPDGLAHVFDAFEQGRARSPRGIGGLGLGLAISKAIVEMHGGSLTAFSEGRGQGATFTLRLPAGLSKAAARRDGARADVLPEDSLPADLSKPKVQAPKSLHILLVEDHVDTAEAMADLLSMAGNRVTMAGTVAEALNAASAADGGFDLVVSDLGLPDGSGVDLMRELSRRYGLKGIALSGYGMDEDVRQSLEAGFQQHLTKPVSLQRLEAGIRQVMSGEEG
ncbi:MAG: two-component system, chemotaxis family, CheB/CheR fusion protein [Acidobacteriota bacterium]|jgi:two-component system CheB/CheR fusion protein|nr:two-component system, chemotaxis family, CheB/CheR fusion protein [Acidobacteriota bacterium]